MNLCHPTGQVLKPVKRRKSRPDVLRDKAYREMFHDLECMICGLFGTVVPAHYRAMIEGVDTMPWGTALKPPDDRCVAICHHAHVIQHNIGEARFWQGLNPVPWANRLYAVRGDIEEMNRICRMARPYFAPLLGVCQP